MSIKGIRKDWYVGKKKSTLITFMGKRTDFNYDDLSMIMYSFPNGRKNGNVSFRKKTDEVIPFNFKSPSSDAVLRAIDLIRENNPELEIQKAIVEQKDPSKETKLCKYCQKEIPYKAIICPYCNRKQKSTKKKIVIGIVVVFTFCGIFSSMMKDNDNTSRTASQQNDGINIENIISYTPYTVDEMMEDLDNNPMNASDKYKGQYIEITGKLGNIDSSGKYISLLPKKGLHFTGVHCSIKNDDQKTVIKGLSIDDIITIQGKCTDVGEVLGYYLDIDTVFEGDTLSTSVSEEPETYNLGDVYEDDNMTVMFLDCGDYTTDNQFLQPENGYKYIFAEFSITNNGNEDISTGAYDFKCYADDTEISKTSLSSSNDAMTSITTLSPGKNVKGKIFFEVPTDVSKIEIQYEIDYWDENRIYFIFE